MAEITLKLGVRLNRDQAVDYKKVDAVREAMMPVLERHGYHIPGIADLCAIAAVRATNPIVGIEPVIAEVR